ncbi:hypothetical protein E4T48_00892 [Aureobasidium sp. EXF-10727]|nr:hypothetical protein E4T48_00892 [Aureobasidium sp. EXF-10727]
MNQANNFWDFVASLQNNQGASPFAEGRGRAADFQGQEFWAPWMSHRGRGPHHGPHGHRHGREGHRPPPPFEHDGTVPPAPPAPHDEPSRSPSPPTPPENDHPHRGPSPHRHTHRGPSPHQHRSHRGPSPHHHGPHHHGPGHRRGGGPGRGGPGHRGNHHGPRGPPPPPTFPFDLNALAEAFAPAIFGDNNPFANAANTSAFTKEPKTANNTNDGTFTPTIDLFSTPQSYILHTSLPGAKKSDVDITYSATRNSITISGVIARPGDVSEETMNCLIVDERTEVGLFEREVKLEEGIKVDEERIGAKLEDGVLRVVVPKVVAEEEEGWESVRKVELE